MIVSGGQKSDSAIHIHVPILPQTSLRWTILKADRVESHELGPWGRRPRAAPPGAWRRPKGKTDSEQARTQAEKVANTSQPPYLQEKLLKLGPLLLYPFYPPLLLNL